MMQRSTETLGTGRMVLDEAGIRDKVKGLASAILKEFGKKSPTFAIIGVQTRGAFLARRVAVLLEKETGASIPVGILDITLYRDDVHAIGDQPEVKETEIPFDIDNRPLVLIDDVLYTGRTVRSAMNALIDFGRPECIRLGVLIDRGHRELPVGADWVGVHLKTRPDDVVDVNLSEIDGEDAVRLRRRARG